MEVFIHSSIHAKLNDILNETQNNKMLTRWKCEVILSVGLILSNLISSTDAHGRLLEPPARNTLWRFGFKAPANYNDNELFCGGIGVSNMKRDND